MATEYKLSYTGAEINEKLGKISKLETEVADLKEGSGIDVTAEVGQTIVVKEVDGNGKPTAWEAVDAQANWEQNDPTAPDYVKCRPFYHIEEEGYVVKDLTLDVPYDSEWMAQRIIPKSALICKNTTYTVTVNGKSYSCTAWWCESWEAVILGNGAILDAEFEGLGEDVPFAFDFYPYDDSAYFNVPAEQQFAGEYTISIHGRMRGYKKLQNNYIPDNVPRIDNAEVGQVIVVLGVDVNGKPDAWITKDLPVYEETYDLDVLSYDYGAYEVVSGSYDEVRKKIADCTPVKCRITRTASHHSYIPFVTDMYVNGDRIEITAIVKDAIVVFYLNKDNTFVKDDSRDKLFSLIDNV